MTTYYRDQDVLVTSSGVRMGGRAYRLAEFDRVWHAHGRRRLSEAAGRGALGLAMLSPLVLGGLAVVAALSLHASLRTTLIVTFGGVLLGLLSVPLADVLLDRVDRSYDRGSRRREIWGRVRGTDVLLLSTDDAQRFGRIYRALERALTRL
jgi:Family of unknown function (DUF6232)